MGTTGDKEVLGRALDAARTLDLNPRIQDMKGLRKLLGFSTQRFNNWKRRGVPKAGILLIADKLGVPVEALREGVGVAQQKKEQPTGGEMTDQEALLLTAFRQADEQARQRFMELARQAIMSRFAMHPAPPAPPQPHQAKTRIA